MHSSREKTQYSASLVLSADPFADFEPDSSRFGIVKTFWIQVMMTGFRLNFSPLKEPLGCVKIVEWLTAIFALGSCGGFAAKNIVSIFCGDGRNETLNVNFHYPFRISQVPLIEGNSTICNHSVSTTYLMGDSSSAAEFFVGVAVFCFLYSMAALLVYLGYMHVYKNSDFGPILDAVIAAIIGILWMVCSSAWAKGLQNIKNATNTEGIDATLAVCKGNNITCEVTEYANLRTLNVSVVFGYINMIVWAVNASRLTGTRIKFSHNFLFSFISLIAEV